MKQSYALVELEQLYNDVQSELPGLDSAHLKRTAHSVINKFLEKSNAWRVTVEPYIEGDICYLTPPDCSVIVYYRDFKWLGERKDAPRQFSATAPYNLKLIPAPVNPKRGDVEVTLILKLLPGTFKIPDYIHDVHYEALRVGVLGRLMSEPVKSYSNGPQGLMYTRQCTSATSEARDIAQRMYGQNESIWRYPAWA